MKNYIVIENIEYIAMPIRHIEIYDDHWAVIIRTCAMPASMFTNNQTTSAAEIENYEQKRLAYEAHLRYILNRAD